MDGFNVIPIGNDSKKTVLPFSTSNQNQNEPQFEVIDEEKEKEKTLKTERSGSLFLILAYMFLLGVVGYFVFLVFYRMDLLNQISVMSQSLKNITQNIDKKEMEEFAAMDSSLKSMEGKLSKHVLVSNVIYTVNQNIRNTLQVSEYRVEVKEKDVDVNIVMTAPSFKELAEQTEKLFYMKEKGEIRSFSVSNLSFESETRRARFSVNIIFDKTKTVANLNNTNLISN
jgi:hypothetical protein